MSNKHAITPRRSAHLLMASLIAMSSVGASSYPSSASAQQSGVLDARLMIDSDACPLDDGESYAATELAGIAALLITTFGPAIVKGVFSGVSAAVRSASGVDDPEPTATANQGFNFYAYTPKEDETAFRPRCLRFVYAQFGGGDLSEKEQESHGAAWTVFQDKMGDIYNKEDDGSETCSNRDVDVCVTEAIKTNFGLSKSDRAPIFYLEARMPPIASGQAFAIEPLVIWRNGVINPKKRSAGNDLSIFFTTKTPSLPDDSNSTFAVGSLHFKGMGQGVYGPDDLKLKSTGALPLSASLDQGKITDIKSNVEAKRQALAQIKQAIKNIDDTKNKTETYTQAKEHMRLSCLTMTSGASAAQKCGVKVELWELQREQEIMNLGAHKEKEQNVVKELSMLIGDIEDEGDIKEYEIAPVNVEVKVIEHKDVDKFLLALSDILAKGADDKFAQDLVAGLQSNIFPDKVQMEKDSLTAVKALSLEILNVKSAEALLEDARSKGDKNAILTHEIAVLNAKHAANLAALDAGQPIPYPNLRTPGTP